MTNTRFVANAKLDPTTYAPLPGSLAVGQAASTTNAPDFTGTIWAVRHTAGAMETLNATSTWSLTDLPNLLDVWDGLPNRAFQDAAGTIPATADGTPVGAWAGAVNGVKLTQTGAARPPLTTTSGRRALALTGSTYFSPFTVPTDGSMTIAMVVNFTLPGTTQTLYTASDGHSAVVTAAGKILVDGVVQSVSAYAGGIHDVIIRETGGNTEIWVDGVRDTAAATGSAMLASVTLSLFNAGGNRGAAWQRPRPCRGRRMDRCHRPHDP